MQQDYDEGRVSPMVSTIPLKENDLSGAKIGNDEFSENRLYISNFPFKWREDNLRDFLKDYGPVESVEIFYDEIGSYGFGLATISDPKRCLEARRALNHTEVDGRRIEIRHAHKRASNTGPPQSQKITAGALQQLQRALNDLGAQLLQMHQTAALQSMFKDGTPCSIPIWQADIIRAYQRADFSNLFDNGVLPTVGETQLPFVQPQQQMGALNEQSMWKTPVSSILEQENAGQLASKAKNDFSQGFWPYSPRKEASFNEISRHYNLFDTPVTGLGNNIDQAQPIYTSAQRVELDDESHEFINIIFFIIINILIWCLFLHILQSFDV